MENICKVHNEPVLFCEQNAQKQMVFLCRICIQQKLKIQNIDDFNNQQKQALNQLELKYEQKIKQFKDFADKVQQYTQQIQQKLNKIKLQVDQIISQIIEKQQQVKNLSNGFTNLQINQINEQENTLNDLLIKIKEQLNTQLKDLEMSTKIDQLCSSLNNLSINLNKNELDQDQSKKKITMIEQNFNYQFIQQCTNKQDKFCGAIAFNKDASIMVAGCSNLIKVFEFINDKLREVQQLNGHQSTVYCLQFMRKSNQFISGSADSTLMIWEYNKNSSWQSIQVLKGHLPNINCITLNKNEDMLISGSSDKTIKFWQKQNNTWNSIQSIDCKSWVWSISLTDFEDKLIASVYDNQILVIQQQGQSWMIKQKISVEQYGHRLCFINQDQFVIQPFNQQHLQIFNYNSKEKEFQLGQKLQYYNTGEDLNFLFPIGYIPQIGLIMVKHYNNIHLIKRSQDGQFKVEQSINFETNYLFGGISDDGRYIATWDGKSREIQIRKFDY